MGLQIDLILTLPVAPRLNTASDLIHPRTGSPKNLYINIFKNVFKIETMMTSCTLLTIVTQTRPTNSINNK